MNLKLKTTLLWVLELIVSSIVVFMFIVTAWLILAYPEIVFSIAMGVFMIYVLISAWVSIYYHLKSKEENKMKNEKVTLDELNQEALEKTYTPVQVRDAITKAYLAYDNDSQRLAFLQGYFSK